MATEDGDLFREMKARKKVKKQNAQTLNSLTIARICKENNYTYNSITSYQVRINGTLDIFTQSKKYHDIIRNKRGIIKGKLTTFITNHFKEQL